LCSGTAPTDDQTLLTRACKYKSPVIASTSTNGPNGMCLSHEAPGYYTLSNGRMPPTNQNITTAGQSRAALDELTLQACTNAKAKGIVIYTVGFSVTSDPIDAQGQNLLQACAPDKAQLSSPTTAILWWMRSTRSASAWASSASRADPRPKTLPTGAPLALPLAFQLRWLRSKHRPV
jgi:hypothetical protein